MGERKTPVDKMTGAVTADKIKGAKPMAKLREAPSPKKALQETAMSTLRVPGVRKIIHTLAFARLVKFLRMIVGFIGIRALPVVALIIGGWTFRRVRRSK